MFIIAVQRQTHRQYIKRNLHSLIIWQNSIKNYKIRWPTWESSKKWVYFLVQISISMRLVDFTNQFALLKIYKVLYYLLRYLYSVANISKKLHKWYFHLHMFTINFIFSLHSNSFPKIKNLIIIFCIHKKNCI